MGVTLQELNETYGVQIGDWIAVDSPIVGDRPYAVQIKGPKSVSEEIYVAPQLDHELGSLGFYNEQSDQFLPTHEGQPLPPGFLRVTVFQTNQPLYNRVTGITSGNVTF